METKPRRKIVVLPKDQRADRRALLALIQQEIEESLCDVSHGYRIGRSIRTAVTASADSNYEWALSTDITKFFDNIRHDRLNQIVTRVVGGQAATAIAFILRKDNPSGVGITQGCPLSPALSNLYLDAMDRDLAQWPMKVIRYADNILCLSKTPQGAAFAQTLVADELAEIGLNLNLGKTSIGRTDSLIFLGQKIGAHLTQGKRHDIKTISLSPGEAWSVSG